MTKKNLREQQRDFTRRLILEALTEIMASGRFKDFTVQDIADRSGVSLATIYRHFPDRETLLRDFLCWSVDRQVERGLTFEPRSTAELPEVIRSYYAGYDEMGELSTAMFKVYHVGDPLIDHELAELRKRRSARYEKVLSETFPETDPEVVQILSALLPYLASIRMWHVFKERPDLDTTRAAEIVSWFVELIIRELGNGTFAKPERPSRAEKRSGRE